MEFAIKLKEKTGKEYLSYTSVKYALSDMRLFELYVQGKLEKKSDAMTFGSVYDCLLFTPEELNNRFVVFDDLKIVSDIGGKNPRATKEYFTDFVIATGQTHYSPMHFDEFLWLRIS